MKVNELMIGDWVRIKGHLDYDKVREIAIDENLKEYISFACSATLFRAYEFEPIPLTEEILKANGFIHKETMEEWWHEEYVPAWGMRMSDFELTDEFEFGRAKITYVHELQHALRLCGLSELADNFKITD